MNTELDVQTFDSEILGSFEVVGEVIAIHGLPESLITNLAAMAQVVDVPHTWRVKQAANVGEVSQETIELAVKAIRDDQASLGANIFCYVTQTDTGLEVVAAGAIRNKLNTDVELNDFPVSSRALVAPQLRGRGLGSAIIRHRIELAKNWFGVPAKAIYFGSRTETVVNVWRKYGTEIGWKLFHLGEGCLESGDGVHIMQEYFLLNPDYERRLLSEAESLGNGFVESLEMYFKNGARAISADNLADEVSQAGESLPSLTEFFSVRSIIGAKDPI